MRAVAIALMLLSCAGVGAQEAGAPTPPPKPVADQAPATTIPPAPVAAPAPKPAPDCSIYSLEGVRLRMSLAEAKAATPEWKWKDVKNDRDRGDHWMVMRGGGLHGTRMDVYLGPDGRVREARRDYIRVSGGFLKASIGPEVPFSSLEEAIDKRFGAVAVKTPGSVIDGTDPTYGKAAVYTMTCWVGLDCDMHTCIEDGTRWEPMATGPAMEIPLLNATIIDGAVIAAEVSAGAAKVKF